MPNFSSSLFNSFSNVSSFESENHFSVRSDNDIEINNSFSPIATSLPIKNKSKRKESKHETYNIIEYKLSVNFCNKSVEFEHLVDSTRADIVIEMESWLDDSVLSSEIFPPNMSVFRRDHSSGKGGGVFIAVSNKYIVSHQP